MKKVCIFTIADNRNLPYFEKFRNSLRKWHKEDEVELLLVTENEIRQFNDPRFFYRAKPLIASQLVGQYEVIIGMDCDQIVCGDISELWSDTEADVLGVLNSNPKEAKTYPVQVWNIGVHEYLNAGLVAMRSKEFIHNWAGVCMNPKFNTYQFGEQDLLNILVHYGPYKTRVLDMGDSFWGLSSKQYWNKIELKDNELVLPKGDEWPLSDKKIKVIHVAGGNTPNKFNLAPYFRPEVLEWIEELMK
jgi:lipopolysaccharide biosynthesis glycosyltransferase